MARYLTSGFGLALFALPAAAVAQAPSAIIAEGLERSQVMMTAHELTDRIGPRLTGSENSRKAHAWALGKMRGYGLTNVRLQQFPFGMGWDLIDSSAVMVAPRRVRMTAIPIAWTPGTEGVLRAPVVLARIGSAADVAAHAGKLAGKIVMVDTPGKVDTSDDPVFKRLSDDDIAKRDEYRLPVDRSEQRERAVRASEEAEKVSGLLKAAGALAVLRVSRDDGKLIHGEGYAYHPGKSPALPEFEVALEDYNRLARLSVTGEAPVVELVSSVKWSSGPVQAANVLGEIKGRDAKAGFVMAGAHFDSWVGGDGAADNGAGSVVVLEAARILKALGARPKRTIRFALWDGEEQALLGSRAYIESYLASRNFKPNQIVDTDYYRWFDSYPITPRPGYREMKAYFNVDNGSGKFRGIHAEQNMGAAAMLAEWMAPYNVLGAEHVVIGGTGGTDHAYFQSVGLNGFQFIQDPLDYGSRVHHTQLDTYDHLVGDDLRQAATVLAGMLLAAANSDQELPRLPLPKAPAKTEPFGF